jgi:hypothetical protein
MFTNISILNVAKKFLFFLGDFSREKLGRKHD